MHPSVPEENANEHPSSTSSSHDNAGSWPHKSHSPVSYLQVPQSFWRCSAFTLPIARHRPSFTSSRRTSYNAWSLRKAPDLSLESPSTAPSGVAQWMFNFWKIGLRHVKHSAKSQPMDPTMCKMSWNYTQNIADGSTPVNMNLSTLDSTLHVWSQRN